MPSKDQESLNQFSSRPNERVDLLDGRTMWLSRATSVVAVIIAIESSTERRYFAIHRRGSATPDHRGKWSLCCGYLDWNESLSQAAARETFQEIGLNLYDLERKGYCTIPDQPYFVQSDPDLDTRQNISARFLFELRVPALPTLSVDHAEVGESEEPQWVELTERNLAERTFAFNHGTVLRDICSLKGWDLGE